MAVGKIPSSGVTPSPSPSEGPKKASVQEATAPNNVIVAKRVPHPEAQRLTPAMNQHKLEIKTGKGLSDLVLRIPVKNRSLEIEALAEKTLSRPSASSPSKKKPREISVGSEAADPAICAYARKKIA